MWDVNSYKRVIIEKTNLCNDKDYLMRYLERLHYLNKVDLIELEKLLFDEWINEIEDEDNRELFKLLPYLSLHLEKYKPSKLTEKYQYGDPYIFNEELIPLNIYVSKTFLT